MAGPPLDAAAPGSIETLNATCNTTNGTAPQEAVAHVEAVEMAMFAHALPVRRIFNRGEEGGFDRSGTGVRSTAPLILLNGVKGSALLQLAASDPPLLLYFHYPSIGLDSSILFSAKPANSQHQHRMSIRFAANWCSRCFFRPSSSAADEWGAHRLFCFASVACRTFLSFLFFVAHRNSPAKCPDFPVLHPASFGVDFGHVIDRRKATHSHRTIGVL